MKKHLTLEQFLKTDLESHYNYHPCGAKKDWFYKGFKGYWFKYTYDQDGNETKYENSDGDWEKYTYDQNGRKLTYEDSDGDWEKYTYDQDGNEKTFEDSDGTKSGFEPKEITMDELIQLAKEKYGNNITIKL